MLEENHKKVALSFDVELWSESDWLKPYITNDLIENDHSFEDSINKILALLSKKDSKATFFVTDTVVKKFPEIVKQISDSGHEIGSHGIGHQRLFNTNKENYKESFRKHIADIEKITGKKVLGFRAPHFSLRPDTYWILELLEESGLKYDSSIFPISMGEYGDSKSARSPYQITKAIKEVPISVFGFGKIKIPYAGGFYFRVLPFFIFKYFLKKESGKDFPPVIYFHPHELETSTPHIKKGPWLRKILKYWGTKNSFKKFEKMLDCYIFDSIETIL